MKNPRVASKPVKRCQNNSVLERVYVKFRECTIRRAVLECHPAEAGVKVNAASNASDDIGPPRVRPPKLPPEQISCAGGEHAGEQAQQVGRVLDGGAMTIAPLSHVPCIKQQVPGVADGNRFCRFLDGLGNGIHRDLGEELFDGCHRLVGSIVPILA